MSREYWVYILANKTNTTVYIGVTNDLERRVNEHKSHSIPGFTKKYNTTKLVDFESCGSVDDAIAREKQLKGWTRAKKDRLIEGMNPEWNDLAQVDWRRFFDFARYARFAQNDIGARRKSVAPLCMRLEKAA